MKRSWTVWPETKLGTLSLVLISITFIFAAALPFYVAIRRSENESPAVAFNVGIPFIAIAIISLIIGWVSFLLLSEGSKVMFIALCILTFFAIVTMIGEFLEVALMSLKMN